MAIWKSAFAVSATSLPEPRWYSANYTVRRMRPATLRTESRRLRPELVGDAAPCCWRSRRRPGRKRWRRRRRRPAGRSLPAWASAFPMKWTRGRCQEVGLWRLFATAGCPRGVGVTAGMHPRMASGASKSDQAQDSEKSGQTAGLTAAAVRWAWILMFGRPRRTARRRPGVDADRDDHRHRDDPAVLADLRVGRVDPEGPGQSPLGGRSRKAPTRSSISGAEPGDLAFEMPLIPSALTRSSTDRVEMP